MPYVTKTVDSVWYDELIFKQVWEGPRPMKYVAGRIIAWTFALGACAAAIWAIVFGISAHNNGLYAGYYYSSAVSRLDQLLAKKYGLFEAEQMRFPTKGPNVINTHLGPKNGVFQSPQVRVFHLIGRQGVRYCVWIWHHNSAQNQRIVKGCRF